MTIRHSCFFSYAHGQHAYMSRFKDELADPSSLNLRFIPAVKAFNAGQHMYLGTLHHYYVSLVNDSQSAINGKGRIAGHPGTARRSATPCSTR